MSPGDITLFMLAPPPVHAGDDLIALCCLRETTPDSRRRARRDAVSCDVRAREGAIGDC